MSSTTPADHHAVYSSGQSAAVFRTYGWRKVDNSTPYIKSILEPHMKVLDVGCGPGSITTDIATYVPQGHVTGIENVESPLEKAREYAASLGVKNVDFQVGDALAIPFPDNTFDLTHAHQVAQHTGDPVLMFREMLRVTKPGGFVACREADHASFVWYPPNKGLTEWHDLFERVARDDGREPNAGRRLHVWAREAGFDPAKITISTGTWCFHTREEREYWGGSMGARVKEGTFAEAAVSKGFATRKDLERISQAWKDWVENDDGYFAILHGEVICRV